MEKKDLIKIVAKNTGVTRSETARVINDAIAVMTDELVSGQGTVRLLGFGTFSTVERPAKVGRNPCTGMPMHIPPALVVRFKEGSVLKRGLGDASIEKLYPDTVCRSVFLK